MERKEGELLKCAAAIMKIAETGLLLKRNISYSQKYIDIEVLSLNNEGLCTWFFKSNDLPSGSGLGKIEKHIVLKFRAYCDGFDLANLLRALCSSEKGPKEAFEQENDICKLTAEEICKLFGAQLDVKFLIIFNKYSLHPSTHCLTLKNLSGKIVIENLEVVQTSLFNPEGFSMTAVCASDSVDEEIAAFQNYLRIRAIFRSEICLTAIFLSPTYLVNLLQNNSLLLENFLKPAFFINSLSIEDPEDLKLLLALDQTGFDLGKDIYTNKVLTVAPPNLKESSQALVKEFKLEDRMCAYEESDSSQPITLDIIAGYFPLADKEAPRIEFVILLEREIQSEILPGFLKCVIEAFKRAFNKERLGAEVRESSYSSAGSFLHTLYLNTSSFQSRPNLLFLLNFSRSKSLQSFFSYNSKASAELLELLSYAISNVLNKIKAQSKSSSERLFLSKREEELIEIEMVRIPSIADSLTEITASLDLFPNFDPEEFRSLVAGKLTNILVFGKNEEK